MLKEKMKAGVYVGQYEGSLKEFNTKLYEEHKKQLEAIKVVGPFKSFRELLEHCTEDYLERNPEMAQKVKLYMELSGGK